MTKFVLYAEGATIFVEQISPDRSYSVKHIVIFKPIESIDV